MRTAGRPRTWGTLGILAAVVPLVWTTSTSTAVIPAPIVISPSQYWDGNDGPWSSFTVQVGSKPQDVRVLISTAGTATMVVIPEGCVDGMPAPCADLRGKLFDYNASTTWKFNNYYDLGLDKNLGIEDSGAFGFDTVALGWQGSGEPILDHQVVAGIATTDFWLGQFGLTPRPTNFTDFNDPQPSFIQTLKNRSAIPSLSWSYTAGAQYRGDKTLASLVLGGYDASKSGPTNMSFPFAQDISKDLTVGIQTITSTVQGVQYDLLPKGIFSFIDSTTPYIWLPLAACQNFEKAFGLTYDNTSGLYLVNDTLHNILLNRNSSVTFKIGNATIGGQTIDITLPYASFDLVATFPLVSGNSSRYFPLQRAANDTQYTLGRTFLQEAYLAADYERSKFYLSQTNFDPLAAQRIITIPSVNSTSSTPATSPHSGLPIAAIVGIAVGCLLLGMILIIAFLFLRRRKLAQSKSKSSDGSVPTPEYYAPDKKDHYPDMAGGFKSELDGGRDSMLPGVELGGGERYEMGELHPGSTNPTSPTSPESQLASLAARRGPVYEMVGDEVERQEMPSPSAESGGEVSPVQRVPSPIDRMPSPIVPMPSLDPTEETATTIDERSHGGGAGGTS